MEHPLNSTISCPVCGGRSTLESHFDDVFLYRCTECDHCFTDPNRLTFFEEYDARYYEIDHKNWFDHPNLRLFESVARFVESSPKIRSILEIGCGRGDLLRFLSRRFPDLAFTGIDYSSNRSDSGITFIQGDALTATPDRSYDLIINSAVIEHIADLSEFMNLLSEHVSPSGYIITMTLNDRSILYGAARVLNHLGFRTPFERLYSRHHLQHFNITSLKQLFESRGLKQICTIHHNIPLGAVDTTSASAVIKTLMRAGVCGAFALGALTGRTYLQTLICQASGEGRLP